MKDSTKRLLLIGGSLLVVGGVVYYFYNKSKSSKPGIVDTDGDGIPDSEDSTPNGEPTTITTPGGGGVGGTVTTAPTTLNTVEKIKAFQDWMDKNHPLWIRDTDGKYKNIRVGTSSEPNRHVGGKGYGIYGPSTRSAFTLFGSSYSPSAGGGGAGTNTNIPADVDKAINLILAKATGPKVKREYLEMRNPSWIKLWASNIDSDKSAFVWGDKTFRTKTGDVVLDMNPIEVAVKVKANGANAYEFPTKTSQKIGVAGGTNVGKVRAVSYNQDALWFYLPDNGGTNKWGLANYFVKA